jgi:chemotaxis signal transduction protein
MVSRPAATRVLRFCAGPIRAAVGAQYVSRILEADSGAPHISSILGVDARCGGVERRTVRVEHAGRVAEFVVDEPVTIVELTRADLRPVHGLDASSLPDFVLGFARDNGDLVALLELGGVLRRLEVWTQEE